MFMNLSRYSGYYPKKDRSILIRTLEMIFSPIRLVWHIVPVLVILNLCGVTNVSWILLGTLLVGHEVLDYLTDIVATIIDRRDKKKEEEKRREESRKKFVDRMTAIEEEE